MSENTKNIIACPICDVPGFSDAYQKVFRVWSQGNREWEAHQVVCQGCGFIYTNPRPSEETLKDFYDSYLRFGEVSSYYREKQIDFLMRSIPNAKGKLLDIGAFDGSFLDLARQKGFEVHGVEATSEGVMEAVKKGLDVVQGFFNKEYIATLRDRYDVVTMLHTLEHVEDPITFVRCALQVMKPGGHLYIEVPDITRPFVENMADSFSVQHLSHFTPNALRNLVSRVGAKVITVEHEKELWSLRILLENTPDDVPLINEYESNMRIMQTYREKKKVFLDNLQKRIPQEGEVSLYGAGEHSSQLLSSGILNKVHVVAVTDSNPKKWGQSFEGFSIIPPSQLPSVPVIISSYDFQEEIADYLKKEFPSLIRIKLYDYVDSYDTSMRSH